MATAMSADKQTVEINYSTLQNFLDVEYPGRILDPQKALKTLGGTDGLTKLYKTPESRIQLRYRPDDIYCKSAYGTCYPTSSVLLNVKQKRNKKTGATKLCVELIGIIATTYKFTTMMDYQYLTMDREGEGDKYRSLKGLCTIEKLESQDWLDNEVPLHFMPQIFSPLDIPYAYHFKEEDNKKTPGDLQSGSLFATARKQRSNFNQLIGYDQEVPAKPNVGADVKIKTAYLKNKMEELHMLFKNRPIWTRAALNAVTKLNNNRLKVILPCVAYNSISGPWRTMWIRHAYDPKQHVEAKHLQLIDYRYRARDKTDMEKKIVTHKRSYSKYLPSVSKAKPKLMKSDQLEHLSKMEDAQDDEIGEEERKMQYMFWPGVVPPYRQLFYQICDIKLHEVEDIVNENNFKEPPCDKVYGFLAANASNQIRSLINKYVLKAIREKQGEIKAGGAEDEDDESEDDKEESEVANYYDDDVLAENLLATYR